MPDFFQLYRENIMIFLGRKIAKDFGRKYCRIEKSALSQYFCDVRNIDFDKPFANNLFIQTLGMR